WLRADLAVWTERLDNLPDSRAPVRSALQRWRGEKALAGIREPEELAKLPEPERAGYLRFWGDVQELLVRCLASPPGTGKADGGGLLGKGQNWRLDTGQATSFLPPAEVAFR